MSAPVGLFDSFDNLDAISVEDIARWLKPVPQKDQLENYLANRILFPQTVPQTEEQMKIDLAILREALRLTVPKLTSTKTNSLLGDNPFLNITLRKVLMPKRFLNHVPDLVSLAWTFLDAFLLDRRRGDFFQDVWTVVLTDDFDEVLGSILLPQFTSDGGIMELSLQGKLYRIRAGSLTVIPCATNKCEIGCKLEDGKILGKQDSTCEVYGGRLGLVVDGRSE